MTDLPAGEGQPYSQEELELFQREYDRALQAELRSVREEEIKAAAQRAAQQEISQHRAVLRGELDNQVEETAESSVDLRDEANREAPSKLLLGLIVLLLLLFLLAVFDRLPGVGEGATAATSVAAADRPNRLEPKLAGATATPIAQVGRGPGGSGETAVAAIDPLFAAYYDAHDGYRLFGLPISALLTYNGRQAQWFERARLEYLPENSGTAFEVAPALIGVEYLADRSFPIQAVPESRPGTRYFPETGYSVSDEFLAYWEANGGIELFGYPISDEVIETPPDSGQSRSVQYFERARFELHIQPDGTQQIMLGLLGRALYRPSGEPPLGAEAEQ